MHGRWDGTQIHVGQPGHGSCMFYTGPHVRKSATKKVRMDHGRIIAPWQLNFVILQLIAVCTIFTRRSPFFCSNFDYTLCTRFDWRHYPEGWACLVLRLVSLSKWDLIAETGNLDVLRRHVKCWSVMMEDIFRPYNRQLKLDLDRFGWLFWCTFLLFVGGFVNVAWPECEWQ